MSDRVLPHSIDAEKAVLGAALISEQAWPIASSLLVEEDFFRAGHRDIFASMRRLSSDGVALDFLTIQEDLRRANTLDSAGGYAYVFSLTDGVPRSTNVEYYARIVREYARLRKLIASASEIMAAAYDGERTAALLVDEAVSTLSSTIREDGGGVVSIKAGIQAYVAALAEGSAGAAVMTGYADVDELVGGFKPGDYVVVAARPSVGKTSWALGAAENMAQSGLNVPFFTLEMTPAGLSGRVLSWRAGVSVTAAERGTASPAQYERLSEAWTNCPDIPLHFEPTASTLAEIEAWCRRLKQEAGAIGCVFVDYIQLLASSTKMDSRQQEIAQISRGLKRLGKFLGSPIVALSQLSRAPEGRADKRPQLSDLRDSGALEQDCDIAILLFRPEMHNRTEDNDGVAEIIVAKHRNGPTGVLRMYFDKELAQFKNLSFGRG